MDEGWIEAFQKEGLDSKPSESWVGTLMKVMGVHMHAGEALEEETVNNSTVPPSITAQSCSNRHFYVCSLLFLSSDDLALHFYIS